MNNEILFKPNALILATANNTITSSELKVYDTLLQRCQFTKDSHWRRAEISLYEIQNLVRDKSKNNLNDIKKLLEVFMSVKIRFTIEKEDYVATLISDYIFNKENATFTCSMTKDVYDTLLGYNEIGYSPLDLKMVRQAKGFYTQKIYQLLRMWSRTDRKIIKEFTIEQIKDVCDIFSGTSYDMYRDFKRRVLVPSIKEINDKLNMKVEYKEIKVMRKVQKIEFTILDFEPRKYDFEKGKIIEPKEAIIKERNNNIDIDPIDYMNLLDLKINESIHTLFLQDYSNYKENFVSFSTASQRTLNALGGKTINKRNYKYFKTTVENLFVSDEVIY